MGDPQPEGATACVPSPMPHSFNLPRLLLLLLLSFTGLLLDPASAALDAGDPTVTTYEPNVQGVGTGVSPTFWGRKRTALLRRSRSAGATWQAAAAAAGAAVVAYLMVICFRKISESSTDLLGRLLTWGSHEDPSRCYPLGRGGEDDNDDGPHSRHGPDSGGSTVDDQDPGGRAEDRELLLRHAQQAPRGNQVVVDLGEAAEGVFGTVSFTALRACPPRRSSIIGIVLAFVSFALFSTAYVLSHIDVPHGGWSPYAGVEQLLADAGWTALGVACTFVILAYEGRYGPLRRLIQHRNVGNSQRRDDANKRNEDNNAGRSGHV